MSIRHLFERLGPAPVEPPVKAPPKPLPKENPKTKPPPPEEKPKPPPPPELDPDRLPDEYHPGEPNYSRIRLPQHAPGSTPFVYPNPFRRRWVGPRPNHPVHPKTSPNKPHYESALSMKARNLFERLGPAPVEAPPKPGVKPGAPPRERPGTSPGKHPNPFRRRWTGPKPTPRPAKACVESRAKALIQSESLRSTHKTTRV